MTRRLAFLLVGLFWALMLAGVAQAQQGIKAGGVGLTYGPGTLLVENGGDFARLLNRTSAVAAQSDFERLLQRGYTPPSAAAKVAESLRLPIGGAAVDVTAVRIASAAGIAGAAAALGGAAWAGAQIGAPISKALGHETLDIGATRCVATNTGWQCDDGEAPTEPPSTVSGYKMDVGGCVTGVHLTPAGAGTEFATCFGPKNSTYSQVPTPNSTVWTYTYLSYNAGNGVATFSYSQQFCNNGTCYPPSTGNANYGVLRAPIQTTGSCPAVIDALNPAYSKAAGGAPGADGKCPTGRYTEASNSKVLDRLMQYGNLGNTVLPNLLTDILTKGGEVPAVAPRDITGPSSAPLPSSPTSVTSGTNPDGSPAPTTTTTGGGTVNITYNGPTITHNNTSTTTTTNNQNSQTTTTTTLDPDDPCAKTPDLISCSKYGAIPDDKPVWKEQNVPYEVEDLGFASGCPVPFSIGLAGGQSVSISYQPVCDFAPTLKPLLIAICALSCVVMIISQTTRT